MNKYIGIILFFIVYGTQFSFAQRYGVGDTYNSSLYDKTVVQAEEGTIFSDSAVSTSMIQNILCTKSIRFSPLLSVTPNTINIECPVEGALCYTRCVEKGELSFHLHAGGDLRTYEIGNSNPWSVKCTLVVTRIPSNPTITTQYIVEISNTAPEQRGLVNYAPSEFSPMSPACSTLNTGDLTGLQCNIIGIQTTGTPPPNLPNLIRLEVGFTTFYAIDPQPNFDLQLGFDPSPTIQVGSNPTAPYIVETNPVKYVWKPNPLGFCPDSFPSYQIQILRLYNDNGIVPPDEYTITSTIDWTKALTLETGSKKMDIALTLPEGRGYYCWRVRAIGNFYPNGARNPANFSEWSYAPSQGAVLNLSSNFNIGAYGKSIFFYNGLDIERNWSYARGFTESDKDGPRASEVMTYQNSMLQPMQIHVSNKTENTFLITHQLYDYSGRMTLATLAVPDNRNASQGGVEYYNEILGTSYGQNSIDAPSITASPSPYNTTTSIGSGNPFSTYFDGSSAIIPTANYIPFSKKKVGSDGRDRELGLPGSTLNIDPSNQRTTLIENAPVLDQELTAVFGDEAPATIAVTKTLTRDPNGLVTAKYVQKDGSTIATCIVGADGMNTNTYIIDQPGTGGRKNLVGEKVNAIKEFEHTITPFPYTRTANDAVSIMSMDYYVPIPGDIELVYTILNEKQFTTRKINFTVPPPNSGGTGFTCEDYCAECDYITTIRVINKNTGEIVYNSDISSPIRKTDNVECSPSDITIPITVQIDDPGIYTVERKITALNRTSGTPTTLPPNMRLEDYHAAQILGGITPPGAPSPFSMEEIFKKIFPNPPTNPTPTAEEILLDYNTRNEQTFSLGSCGAIILPHEKCENGCIGGTNSEKAQKFEEYLRDRLEKIGMLSINHYDIFCDRSGNPKLTTNPIFGGTGGWFNQMIENMLNCDYLCDEIWNIWKATVEEYAMLRLQNSLQRPYLVGKQNGDNELYYDLYETFLDRARRFKQVTDYSNVNCTFAITNDYYDGQTNNTYDYLRNGFRTVYIDNINRYNAACGPPPTSPSSGFSTAVDQSTWVGYQKCVDFTKLLQDDGDRVNGVLNDLGISDDPISNPPTDEEIIRFFEKSSEKCEQGCHKKIKEFEKLYVDMMANAAPPHYRAGTPRPNTNPIQIVAIGDPDWLPESKIECAKAMLLHDCIEECDMSIDPVTLKHAPGKLERFREVFLGKPEVALKLDYGSGYVCPITEAPNPPYRELEQVSLFDGANVANALVQYLNSVINNAKNEVQYGGSKKLDLGQIGCEYLYSLGITNPPSCICNTELFVFEIDRFSRDIKIHLTNRENAATCCDIVVEYDQVCAMPPGESIADRLNQYLDLTWGRPVNQDVKPNFINSDPNTSPFYRTTIAGPAMTYGCDVASGIMTDIGSKDLYGKVGAFEAYAPKIAYFYPVFQKITSDYKQSRLSSEINSSTTPLLTGSPFFMDPVQINYKYTNSLSPVFGRKIYNDNENCEKLANILFKMGNIETIYSPITIEYLPMFEHIQAGSDKNTSFDENGMRYPHNYCGIFNTLTFNIYDQNYRIKDGKSVLLEKYSNYPLSHINIWRGNRPANSVILTHNPMAHATRMFGPVYVRLPYNSLAPDLKIPFVGNLKDYEEQPYLYVALRPMVLEKNSLDFYNSPQCSDRTAEFLYEGSVLTYYPIYGAELQLFYGERPQTKDPHDDFYDLMTLIERNRNNGNMINFEFFPDHD
ncbi:MAG: hypothetical protein ACK6BZ_03570, partial [Candidatus Kapaibacterium sp.]